MNAGPAELLFLVFGLGFALLPLILLIVFLVGLFRRLDRIVAATEATAEGVRRLEQERGLGGPPPV